MIRSLQKFFCVLTFMAVIVAPFLAAAATTVTNAFDQPTSLEVSTDSNHKFSITVASNVDEGDTLVLTFPPAFDTAAIGEDDVDVADDGIDLTTEANCSGAEQASVSMLADVLTITICAGDGGAIAAGSLVTIEIGTNASASGTGSSRIENPGTEGTYYVNVNGTFGDYASIPIPIISLIDGGEVSAVVPAASSSTGGGSTGVSDTITVTDPNGGESIDAGSTYTVTWSTTGSNITLVDLYYTLDGGSTYTLIIADETNDGSYSWSVPNVASSLAAIRLEGSDTSSVIDTDESDSVFSIVVAEEPPTEEPAEETPAEETPTEEPAEETPAEETPTTESPTEETPTTETPEEEAPTTTPTTTPSTTTTTPTTSTEEPTPERTIEAAVSAADGSLSLDSSADQFDALTDQSVVVDFTVSDPSEITSVVVTFGDDSLSPTSSEAGEYSVSVPVGGESETFTVLVTYADGTTATKIFAVTTSGNGQVYELISGTRTPVSEAVVIVYSLDGGVRTQWDSRAYGQANPVLTGSSGAIGWYVPNGTYVVTVGKNGYVDSEVIRTVNNNILAPFIELKPEEPVEPEEIPSEPETPTIPEEPVSSIEEPGFLESPAIQATADLTLPVAAVTAVAATTLLASSFGLLPLLQYIFSAPILFFARRRRQTFGVIYNAYTKVPIDLAIVRLLNQAGKIVRTMVTDKEGRYFFKVDPGTYSIKVIKNGFVFPSVYIGGVREDGKFLDVYSGGPLIVDQKDAIIAANIPLDPADQPAKQTAKYLRWRRVLRVFQHLVAISGVVASLVVVIISPSALSIFLFILNLLIYIATQILVKPKKRKGWGIVYDEKSQKAVPNAVVRLFEPKYNKLVESTLTDGQGRYAFLVGANEYYTTYEHSGYQKTEVRPIDYKQKPKPELISIDVPLRGAV